MNIVADDCRLSCNIFFRGKGRGAGEFGRTWSASSTPIFQGINNTTSISIKSQANLSQ